MKGITSVGATPQRVAILYDFLAEAGPAGENRERLGALLGPAKLAVKADAGADNAFNDCLSAAEEMGLVRLEDGDVRVADGTAPRSFVDLADARAIVAPEDAASAAGWLAGAVSWMLMSDPLDPLPWSTSRAVMRLRKDVGETGPSYGMTNDSRFQQAVYWARALGYVDRQSHRGEESVLPDPTPAITWRLDALLPASGEVPLGVFLSDLAASCPVLDGGRIRTEVEATCGRVRDPGSVSASLALALCRLRQRGVLGFRHLSDAGSILVAGLPDGRASHVGKVAR